jgi:hypothetical protein
MEALRLGVQSALRVVDSVYQRAHGLQPLGKVLLLGSARHRGGALSFADGTCVQAGSVIGVLHFNNAGFQGLQSHSGHAAARAFVREMVASMQELAEVARGDPRFADIAAFHATSWLPPHGRWLGFVALPAPPGPATRARAAWFRLLLWAFAPARETRERARPDPHDHWLTRRELLTRFPVKAQAVQRNPAPTWPASS